MKVECIQSYFDRLLNETIEAGKEIECDEERANTLIAFGVAKKLEESSPSTNETNTEVKTTTGGWFR